MSARETEAATRLRTYAALVALVPGGIYVNSALGTEGLTSPTTTPGAYSGGLLRTSIVVRARAPAPGLRLLDLKRQHADANQAVECWVYSRDATAIEPILNLIYTRLQGFAFKGAWPATWNFNLGPMPMPDNSLGPGVHFARQDFLVVSIRRPVPV